MSQGLAILILDPRRRLEAALPERLRQQGWGVTPLSGSLPAPLVLAAEPPDLVLIEVDDEPSREWLGAFLGHRSTRRIPVIALATEPDLAFEFLELFDFFSLPLDYQQFFDALARLAECCRRTPTGHPDILCAEDRTLFQEFLARHSGLHFDQGNGRILERALGQRLRALRLATAGDYFAYLERHGESRQELKKLLTLLTVGETSFFRYRSQFEALQQRVIPELIERNRRQRSLRFWSAGCSTGEEPYSLAMLLLEDFPELRDWQVEILATDINPQALQRARRGSYSERALRVTEDRYRQRYFVAEQDRWLVTAAPRKLVRFASLNLQTGRYPAHDTGTAEVDLLLCRNVMIYFSAATNRAILERFSRCLRPGGYLLLGHAETVQNLSEDFRPVHHRGGFYYTLAPAAPDLPQALPAAAPSLTGHVPGADDVTLEPGTEPDDEALLEAARAAFDREEFDRAERHFTALLERRPNSAPALTGMGYIRANQERYAAALEFCARALAADDLQADVYFLRGLIYELQQNLTAAIEEYRKALLLDLDFVMPHYHLSRIYRRLGRVEEARRELHNTRRLLERLREDGTVPYAGGLSRTAFMALCRDEAGALGDG